MKNLTFTFLKYVGLNIMGMIGTSCFILADTFFIAKAMGSTGLAALNFAISVVSILQGFALMTAIGCATDFSIKKHSSHRSNANSFTVSIILGAVISIIFFIIGVFFAGPLSTLLGADSSTFSMTKTYISTMLALCPFSVFNYILIAFVRNDQNPRLATIAMLSSSMTNILLDYIFIFPLSMGIFGAAFATAISPIISICILSTHILSKKNTFHTKMCKFSFREAFHMLSLGVSSFIGELASAIALITFNLIIIGLEGNTGVAAYGIVANIAFIATAIYVGVSQGLQPLVSKYYAKDDKASVRHLLKCSTITALAISTIIYLIILVFVEPITAAFNTTNDRYLGSLAISGMKIYFIGFFFAGINIVSSSFLSASAKARSAMIISLLRSCLLIIPLVFLLSFMYKMTGVWMSFVVTECIVAIISAYLLFSFISHFKAIKLSEV